MLIACWRRPEMEHEERSSAITIAGSNLPCLEPSGESEQKFSDTGMPLDASYLYSEVPVDGEMVAFPYTPEALACAQLESLVARPDRVGIDLSDE
jgi:hypothetical protein